MQAQLAKGTGFQFLQDFRWQRWNRLISHGRIHFAQGALGKLYKITKSLTSYKRTERSAADRFLMIPLFSNNKRERERKTGMYRGDCSLTLSRDLDSRIQKGERRTEKSRDFRVYSFLFSITREHVSLETYIKSLKFKPILIDFYENRF